MSRRRSAFVCFGSPALTTSSSWSATAAKVGGVGRCGRSWGELGGEGAVLLVQVGEARFERGDARLESLCVEVAGFEGGVVAVEGAFGPPDLLGECAALFFERRAVRLPLLGRGVDRVSDHVSVPIQRREVSHAGGFEVV